MKRMLILIYFLYTSFVTFACSFLNISLDNLDVLSGGTSGRISVDSKNNLILYIGKKKAYMTKVDKNSKIVLWHGCGFPNYNGGYWELRTHMGTISLTMDASAIKKINSWSSSHAAHASHISHYSGK